MPPRPLIASDASFKIGPTGGAGSQPQLLTAADKTAMLATVNTIPLFRYRYVGGTTTQHTGPYAVTYNGSTGWNSAFPNGTPAQSSCLLDIGDVCGTLVGCVQALAGNTSGGQWTSFTLATQTVPRTGLTMNLNEGIMLCVPFSTDPTATAGRRMFYDGSTLFGGALNIGDTRQWAWRPDCSFNWGVANTVRNDRSVALGGYNNDVQAYNSYAVGSDNVNVICPYGGVIGGSFNNLNGGTSSAVLTATNCTLNGCSYSGVVGGRANRMDNVSDTLMGGCNTCTLQANTSAMVGCDRCYLAGGKGVLCTGQQCVATYGENSAYIGVSNSILRVYNSLVAGGNQGYASNITNSVILGGSWSDGTVGNLGSGNGGGLSNTTASPSPPTIANAVYMGYGRNTNPTALSNCMTAIFNGENPSSSSFVFCSTDNGTSGANVRLAAGGNSWIGSSRRELKQDFRQLDEAEVTARVRKVPLYTYRFKGAADRSVGPVAEEWAEAMRGALPLPADAEADPSKAEGINVNDALYATMAAVKDAHRRIDSLYARDRHRGGTAPNSTGRGRSRGRSLSVP